jgi:hypothetical protein
MTTPTNQTTLDAHAVLEILDHVEGFAALAGVEDEDIVHLALSGLPRGTKEMARQYGVIDDSGDDLTLTEFGRDVVAAASERCPDPFAGVSLADIVQETRASVRRVVEQKGPSHVEEAQRAAIPTKHSASGVGTGAAALGRVVRGVSGHVRQRFDKKDGRRHTAAH